VVRVYIAQNPTEAHFVRGLLETQLIECVVKGETLFAARGEVPLTIDTAPSVWIYDREQLEQARTAVSEYERAMREDSSGGETWVCEICGEEHESQFTSCWKCAQ
jgi:hypothetical protein